MGGVLIRGLGVLTRGLGVLTRGLGVLTRGLGVLIRELCGIGVLIIKRTRCPDKRARWS